MIMNFIPEAEFDFHKLDKVDAFEIELHLDQFIQEQYNNNLTKILIITGKGKVVKPVVKELLEKHILVKQFKKAGYFNGQGGAFEVILKN